MLRRVDNRECNKHKTRKCVAINKEKNNWKFDKCFYNRHGVAEHKVYSVGFQSFFGSVFHHYAFGFLPVFWNSSVYLLSLYVGSV